MRIKFAILALTMFSLFACVSTNASDVEDWSTTDASNNSAPPAGAPENMAPSAVNDVMRAIMGGVKRQFYDQNGSITTGGTGNAYTATSNTTPSALAVGQMYVLEANHTNTGAATLQINALAATAIVLPDGSALVGGEIVSGGVYGFVYDGTSYQLFTNIAEKPDKLYFGSAEAAGTEADGITVRHTTSNSPAIDFYSNAGVLEGTITADNTNGLSVSSKPHGAPVELKAETAGGVSVNVFRGDPDTSAELMENGSTALTTSIRGVLIDSNTAGFARIQIRDDGGDSASIYKIDGSYVTLRNEQISGDVRLEGTDSGSTTTSIITGSPDGAAQVFYDGDPKLRTTTDANGGVQVDPGTGYMRVPAKNVATKATAETVTSSTTLQDDDDLTLPIPAAGFYRFTLHARITSGSSTPDLKFAFNSEANMSNDSYTYVWGAGNDTETVSRSVFPLDEVEQVNIVGLSDGALSINGGFQMSAAGTITFRWAQNTSSASGVAVQPAAHLTLEYLGN